MKIVDNRVQGKEYVATYGDILHIGGTYFLIAQTSMGRYNLIALDGGNRFTSEYPDINQLIGYAVSEYGLGSDYEILPSKSTVLTITTSNQVANDQL